MPTIGSSHVNIGAGTGGYLAGMRRVIAASERFNRTARQVDQVFRAKGGGVRIERIARAAPEG